MKFEQLKSEVSLFSMDKGVPPSLFANDGSFMERFKQLQQEKKSDNVEDSRQKTNVSRSSTPNSSSVKIGVDITNNNQRKPPTASSGGKLAFSLKQKSKLAVPSVKLSEDEEDVDAGNASDGVSAKRQRLNQPDISSVSSRKFDVGNVCLYRSFMSCLSYFNGFVSSFWVYLTFMFVLI